MTTYTTCGVASTGFSCRRLLEGAGVVFSAALLVLLCVDVVVSDVGTDILIVYKTLPPMTLLGGNLRRLTTQAR